MLNLDPGYFSYSVGNPVQISPQTHADCNQ
jgi:hypothetical protein